MIYALRGEQSSQFANPYCFTACNACDADLLFSGTFILLGRQKHTRRDKLTTIKHARQIYPTHPVNLVSAKQHPCLQTVTITHYTKFRTPYPKPIQSLDKTLQSIAHP